MKVTTTITGTLLQPINVQMGKTGQPYGEALIRSIEKTQKKGDVEHIYPIRVFGQYSLPKIQHVAAGSLVCLVVHVECSRPSANGNRFVNLSMSDCEVLSPGGGQPAPQQQQAPPQQQQQYQQQPSPAQQQQSQYGAPAHAPQVDDTPF